MDNSYHMIMCNNNSLPSRAVSLIVASFLFGIHDQPHSHDLHILVLFLHILGLYHNGLQSLKNPLSMSSVRVKWPSKT